MLHIHHLLTGYGESDAEYGSDDESSGEAILFCSSPMYI